MANIRGEVNIYGAQMLRPRGYQQIADLSAVVALTVPVGALGALLQCEVANLRFLDNGANPDANTGMILVHSQQPVYYEGDLAALRFIQTAANAKLNVLYYG